MDAALAWAANGYPVFPCRPAEKRPATEHGFEDATTDPEQIRRWWTENPDYNVAIYPGAVEVGVVDIEAGGSGQWAELIAQNGYDGTFTYTVETPRGGQHLYFDGPVPSSTKRLARKNQDGSGGIDTRGIGGYVLVPPSRTEHGVYRVLNNAEIVPVPAFVLAALRRDEPSGKAQGEPVSYAHVVELLHSIDPGCDYETWRDVIGGIRACNFIEDVAALQLADAWSAGVYHTHQPLNYVGFEAVEKCFDSMPPKPGGVGYGTILHYARQSGYAGPSAVDWREPAATVFADALVKLPPETSPPGPSPRLRPPEGTVNRFRPTNDTEWADIPEQAWAIEGIIPADGATVVAADTGHYKTFVALDMALSCAAGLPFSDRPVRKGLVFYGAGEGRNDIRRKRAPAWRLVKGLASVPDFYVMPIPRISIPDEGEAFIAAIRETAGGAGPVMIVLDTYARVMGGLNENDAQDVGLFTVYADRLRDEFPGVAVVILAHTGKDKTRGTRGSSALRANTDTYIEIESDRQHKVVDFHVAQHRDADDGYHVWFHGKAVADSLYFQPITEAEARKLVAVEGELSGAKVGRALREMGAIGREKAVTTKTLAEVLKPLQPNQAIEEWEALTSKTARELGRLASGQLAAYCDRHGNRTVWYLPA